MSEQSTQLWLRLAEQEKNRVDEIARAEKRSRAAQLQVFVQQGIAQYDQKKAPTAK